jgi:hypothetical protein
MKTVKEEYEHRKQLTEEAKQRRDALLLQLLRTSPESREELKRKAKATSKRASSAKRILPLEALLSEHIALADRHLREAKERVALQRLRVTNSVGQEREKAEALLETFLQILDQMRKHRALLDEELRLCRS